MKELLSTAMNTYIVTDEEKPRAMCEIILVLTEPQWRADSGGGMTKHRVAENFRFNAMPETLRKLSKIFDGYADLCDERMAEVLDDMALADATSTEEPPCP